MPFHRLSTAKIARITGVHPNTVRLYERWGFLSPVPRSPTGYRLFSVVHVDQMRLARLVMSSPWLGRDIRQASIAIIRLAVEGDLNGALDQAYTHLNLVRLEIDQAKEAAEYVERWVNGGAPSPSEHVQIKTAAEILRTTPDALRNWERSGLICIPRNPTNGYRLYGSNEIDRLRVIRLLIQTGYSVMAVLRMLVQLDQGRKEGLGQLMIEPLPNEDVFSVADRWLPALREQEQRALRLIDLLHELLDKQEGNGKYL